MVWRPIIGGAAAFIVLAIIVLGILESRRHPLDHSVEEATDNMNRSHEMEFPTGQR